MKSRLKNENDEFNISNNRRNIFICVSYFDTMHNVFLNEIYSDLRFYMTHDDENRI